MSLRIGLLLAAATLLVSACGPQPPVLQEVRFEPAASSYGG
jgi:hypothetical protein